MKLALVNGDRREPAKGLLGVCIGCGQPMIPKCGPVMIHHWAHKADCECDRWWESETEWHRAWKNRFPVELQEIWHRDEVTGEWHIADVKTKPGNILEFQHSFLKMEEREARNKFYGDSLVWIVDGLTRKNDFSNFEQILKTAKLIAPNSPIAKMPEFDNDQPLLRDWSDCKVPVFFDFGSHLPLWCLLPKSGKGHYYIVPFSRDYFVSLLNVTNTDGQTFCGLIKTIKDNIYIFENPHLIINLNRLAPIRRAPLQRTLEMPQNPSRRFINFVNRNPGRFRF